MTTENRQALTEILKDLAELKDRLDGVLFAEEEGNPDHLSEAYYLLDEAEDCIEATMKGAKQ